MIEVTGFSKLYGEFAAVHDLSFSVRPGEVLGLVGPNGAGKTSTLRCMAGIIPPSRGKIRIDGFDFATHPLEAKRRLAFFSDEPRLFDYLTVRQHLIFSGRLYGVADVTDRMAALLEELELTAKADELPGALSRGMKQKVAIACGLIHSPRVILLDEPLTGLDPLAIRKMKDTIRRLAAEGACLVISSHLLHLLEELCSHVLVLRRGAKVVHGTLAEIRHQFAGGDDSVDLEELFLRITSQPEPPAATSESGGVG